MNLIKMFFLYAVGLAIMPSIIRCSLEDIKTKKRIVIVGAGAAGLYAGYLLEKLGLEFTILEANSIHGGRLGKLEGFADYDIDTGGQWLHGINNIIGQLVTDKNIKITLDDAPYSFYFKNELISDTPKETFIFEGKNLPDSSFRQYSESQGLDETYNFIIDAIAGINGASPEDISAYWNYYEGSKSNSGKGDFKFERTYFDLINEHFAIPISDKIKYNEIVKSIDYSKKKVVINTESGAKYISDKILLTVPISILKENTIQFKPKLPKRKTDAFAKIGIGPGLKIFLKFKRKFYPDNILGGKTCAAYYTDSIGKITDDNIIIAFIMGNQAKALSELSNDLILKSLLSELDLMFNGLASENYIDFHVINYAKMPFIRGAYSYSTIGMGNARQVAAKPLNKKIYFAGEAMNLDGNHQTVHGALESSKIAIEAMFL